jgi:hypothetical protein
MIRRPDDGGSKQLRNVCHLRNSTAQYRNIPEGYRLRTRRRENLKSYHAGYSTEIAKQEIVAEFWWAGLLELYT